MVGCQHRLSGHEFEQTQGDGEGQGGLACCHPGGLRELDTTERLNSHNMHKAVVSMGLVSALSRKRAKESQPCGCLLSAAAGEMAHTLIIAYILLKKS